MSATTTFDQQPLPRNGGAPPAAEPAEGGRTLNSEATTQALGELRGLMIKARDKTITDQERARAVQLLDEKSGEFRHFVRDNTEVAKLDGVIAGSFVTRMVVKFVDFLSLPAIMSVFVARKKEYGPHSKNDNTAVASTVGINTGLEAGLSAFTAKDIVDVAYKRSNLLIGLRQFRSDVNPDVKRPGTWGRLGMLWNALVIEEGNNLIHMVRVQWHRMFSRDRDDRPPPKERNRATDDSLRHTAKDLDKAYLTLLGKDGYRDKFGVQYNGREADENHFGSVADDGIARAARDFKQNAGPQASRGRGDDD